MLGSDARTKGSKEPGANKIGQPSRSDSILLMRIGGGHNATLSIPRDTVVPIPGHGEDKINAAYAYRRPRARDPHRRAVPRHPDQPPRRGQLRELPAADRRARRHHLPRRLRRLAINGGFKNGGYTLRLKAGKQEIDGKQALALARTRKNECNAKENDLTRARRQQKIIGAIKDKVTSFETFVRLPWVSWAAPKAIRSDMSGPSLLGLVGAELTAGTAKPTVLKPTGAVTSAQRRPGPDRRRRDQARAVERFLR